MLERGPTTPKSQELDMQDKNVEQEDDITKLADKYDFILDADEYNELLHKRNEIITLSEELKKVTQHNLELTTKLTHIKKQKELAEMEANYANQEIKKLYTTLKTKEAELDEARRDIVSLNAMFVQEQSSHQDTCDQLNTVSKAWSQRFQELQTQFDAELMQAKRENNRLQNLLLQENGLKFSNSASKYNLFKGNKAITNKGVDMKESFNLKNN